MNEDDYEITSVETIGTPDGDLIDQYEVDISYRPIS